MAALRMLGDLSDRLGRRPVLFAGWLFHAGVCAGFALFEGHRALVALFLACGLYFGLAEPVERAWAADPSPLGQT